MCSHMNISSGTEEWEPIALRDPETGEFHGIAFDMIREIARRLKIELTVVRLPMKRMQSSLSNGSIDVAVSLYKNKERLEKFVYSIPYFSNEARIFVKKGREFPFNEFNDLIGKKGIVPAGGSFGEKFDTFAKHNLDLYKVHTDITNTYHRMVINERKDFFVADYLDGMTTLRKRGLEGKIVALDKPIDTNYIHFVFSKNSSCLSMIDKFNSTIETLKEKGFITSLTRKYLSR